MDLEEEKKDVALLLKQTRGIQTEGGNNGMFVNQVYSYSKNSVIDYGRVLPQSDGSSSGVGQRSVRDAITAGGQSSNNVGEKQISFGESVQVFD
ncbi:hypothetical protein Tco_0755388 [Tanacetum coccineum]